MGCDNNKASSSGFNLIELIVVIATISVLALVVLPTFAKTDSRGQSYRCLNNSKQLVAAWLLYSEDNRGNLVPNGLNDTASWVSGDMQNSLDRTNTARIQNGLLFPYTKSVEAYKCPENHTTQVRGVSMNMFMASPVGSTSYRTFTKMAQIDNPSQIFVTMDEDPQSIDDPIFAVTMVNRTMWNWPGTSHDGAGTIGFADGHTELHPWRILGAAPIPYSTQPKGLFAAQVKDGDYLTKISSVSAGL